MGTRFAGARGGTLTSGPALPGARLPRGEKGTGPCLALVDRRLARPISGEGGNRADPGLAEYGDPRSAMEDLRCGEQRLEPGSGIVERSSSRLNLRWMTKGRRSGCRGRTRARTWISLPNLGLGSIGFLSSVGLASVISTSSDAGSSLMLGDPSEGEVGSELRRRATACTRTSAADALPR